MNPEDRAIIIGVTDYPGLTSLSGPENDAIAFHKWLIDPTGGGVPPGQAELIVSSSFNDPPFGDAANAEPTEQKIYRIFQGYKKIANQNKAAKKGLRVGRRLYLYFAGHGIAPNSISEGFAPTFEDAALLMANAEDEFFSYHIPGKSWANLFFMNGYFDEVVLLMDCCRENYPNTPPNFVKQAFSTTYKELDENKLFYGFATKWNKLARERKMDDGEWHGVFTTALIAGLRGAAADPATGEVTARTLGNYLRENMKWYFDPADLNNAKIEKDPHLKYYDKSGNNLVFAQVPVTKFPVRIYVSPQLAGKKIEIQGNRNGDPFHVVTHTDSAPEPFWEFEIEWGHYQALGGGKRAVFNITGKVEPGGTKEVTDVNFK